MNDRIVVTGLGLVCGIGGNVEECWRNALGGVSGIKPVQRFDTAACYAHMGAEVRLSDPALCEENLDRSARLCIRAAREALDDAGLDPFGSERVGVILGSCVGGAASIDKYYSGEGDASDIPKMSASALANSVARYFHLNGPTATIVNACAAGTMSLSYACTLIRAGKADAFVAGGADSFSSLAFSGFHALHALDADVCSPFNRSEGITLGEGSGVLMIESYEHAVQRGAKIYCEILGSGVASDAYHITAPRPDGEGQMTAIRRALARSGVAPTEIDYINAHGTGTAKNDEAEFLSLHTIFDGSNRLSVSSTKSMTGHCLGAAGSIEAVLTVKAVSEDAVLPTTGFADDDLPTLYEKAGDLDFVTNTGRRKPVRFAMSNSFAFGGTDASIIFSGEHRAVQPAPAREPIYVTGVGKVIGRAVNITSADFKAQGIKMAFYRKLDRFSQLQLLSGVAAVQSANLTIDKENESEVGIIIGTADGPMKEIAEFQKNAIANGVEKGSAFAFPNTVYNAAGGYLSIFTGAKGYNATISNFAQAGLQSLCYACDVLRAGEAHTIFAAGTDELSDIESSLYSAAGFLKPLGEGSVTLVLENRTTALSRHAALLAELAGCATAHDSTGEHGAAAMKRAIFAACADAQMSIEEIDAVCADSHDTAEVFGRELPVYHVREDCGEARAAAAAMQAACAVELLQQTDMNAVLAVCGSHGAWSAVVFRRVNDEPASN